MNNWQDFINTELKEEYFINLNNILEHERQKYIIYPPKQDVFNAFYHCSLSDIKVVIIGQDPYHNKGQANGLAFSVNDGISPPPSLKNIFKEISNDIGGNFNSGNLQEWAKQGVFLLNSILTVRENSPGSHKNYGWAVFTNKAIKIINSQDRPIVYLLWGNFAKSKKCFLTNKKHLVLEASHPSPFSAHDGFFGCKHFSKTNEFLLNNKIQPINWNI